jgi:glycosyltransferase involved in cell wall biosynthesis
MTRVAVCVPVYDEADHLRTLLAALPGDVHVIVAVDGGDPACVRVAEEAGAHVVVVTPNQGSYAARNAAIDALPPGVDVVLFTDADCVPTPSWVPEHVAALEHADLSGGGVEWLYSSDPPAPAEFVDSQRHLHQRLYVERDGYAATCNLGVRRSVLDSMRFDASLRTGGDAEFGRRATASGYRLVYTEKAAIRHVARPDRAALMKKVRRIVSGIPAQKARWVERGVPPGARLTRGPWRRARQAGLDVGPWWGLQACLLDWEANVRIRRAVKKVLS